MTLVPFLLTVCAAASIGATFRPGTWYRSLDKPSWTPPDWLFAPAWTVLFTLIAVAGWRVWAVSGWGWPMAFWAGNLIFNAVWSWLMFGRKDLRAALVDASLMLLTILAFMVTAWPIDQTAALLFTPYLAWTSFATALNFAIFRRNR